jgi:hypothetical protein
MIKHPRQAYLSLRRHRQAPSRLLNSRSSLRILRDSQARLLTALSTKANEATALQKENEALKAEGRPGREAASTSTETANVVESDEDFDRQSLVEIRNYLIQATRELEVEVKKCRT